jgi:glycine dehydrogenase subunit 1
VSRYIPNTELQRKEMLSEIGMKEIADLFDEVPENVKLKQKLDIPEAMSEMEIISHMRQMANKNTNVDDYTCFLGAGAYDH